MEVYTRAHASVVKSTPSGLLSLRTQKKGVNLKKKYKMAIKARYGDYNDYFREGPSTVDANMSVLRRRVYEQKLQESCYSPSHDQWMEWEKNMRSEYYSTISQATGNMQWWLMSTRPTIALATLTLVLMGVGTSVGINLLIAWSSVDLILHNLRYWVS